MPRAFAVGQKVSAEAIAFLSIAQSCSHWMPTPSRKRVGGEYTRNRWCDLCNLALRGHVTSDATSPEATSPAMRPCLDLALRGYLDLASVELRLCLEWHD